MSLSDRARKGLIVTLTAVIALVMLALLVFSLLQYWLNSNNATQAIANMIGTRLDVEAKFSSDLEVHLFPRPSITVRELALHSLEDRKLLVNGQAATLEIALIPLLGREIRVNSLIVEGVDVYGLDHWFREETSTSESGMATPRDPEQAVEVTYPARTELRQIRLLNTEKQPQFILDQLVWSEASSTGDSESVRRFQSSLVACQEAPEPLCLEAAAMISIEEATALSFRVDVTGFEIHHGSSSLASGALEFQLTPVGLELFSGNIKGSDYWKADIMALKAEFSPAAIWNSELALQITGDLLPFEPEVHLLIEGTQANAHFTFNLESGDTGVSHGAGALCWSSSQSIRFRIDIDQLDSEPWIKEPDESVTLAEVNNPAISATIERVETFLAERNMRGEVNLGKLLWPGGIAQNISIPFSGVEDCELQIPEIRVSE